MSITLNEEIRTLLSDCSTLKVLATLTPQGEVHSAVKQSLFSDNKNRIIYLEYFEKSQTNINLVNSIWFDKSVTITAVTVDHRSFFIKGKPYKTLVSGKEFERYYTEADRADKENDLVAVYYIEPVEVYEQTFAMQRSAHKSRYPLYAHLDKYAD